MRQRWVAAKEGQDCNRVGFLSLVNTPSDECSIPPGRDGNDRLARTNRPVSDRVGGYELSRQQT